MIGPSSTGILVQAILLCGLALLAGAVVGGIALVLIGSLNTRLRAVRRIGVIALATALGPVIVVTYVWLRAVDDGFTKLGQATVVDGIALPKGTRVKREASPRPTVAKLPGPHVVEGIEYISELRFHEGHVETGTLARDQEIQGFPCGAKTAVSFLVGRLESCVLARPFQSHRVTWPKGSMVVLDSGRELYRFSKETAPVRVGEFLVHSGLQVEFSGHRLAAFFRNYDHPNPDLKLEAGGLTIVPADSIAIQVTEDGTLNGGVLFEDAEFQGKRISAGDPIDYTCKIAPCTAKED